MRKSEKRRLSPFLFQKQTRIVRRIGYNMLVYGVVLAVFTVPAVFGVFGGPIVCASKDEGAAALVTLTPETADRFYKSLSRGEYSPDPTGIL